jgi:hypothetical protein
MPFRPIRPPFELALTALLAISAPAGASAILTQHFEDEAAFGEYLTKHGLDAGTDMLLMAQGRSGDNRIGGAWEVGLFLPDDLADAKATGATAQFEWPQAKDGHPWVPFSLSRTDGTLTFSVGDAVVRVDATDIAGLTALALSARVEDKGETTILRSLTLDGDKLEKGNVNAMGDKRDVALVEGLSDTFTLAGEARLRWAHVHDLTDPARLMFQISGYRIGGDSRGDDTLIPANAVLAVPSPGNQAAIPEPATALVFLSAALGLIGHQQLRRLRGRDNLAG